MATAAKSAGSQLPDKGSNPCPWQWKYGVLTTGPPGKSLFPDVFKAQHSPSQAQLPLLALTLHPLLTSPQGLQNPSHGVWGRKPTEKAFWDIRQAWVCISLGHLPAATPASWCVVPRARPGTSDCHLSSPGLSVLICKVRITFPACTHLGGASKITISSCPSPLPRMSKVHGTVVNGELH